MKNFFFAVLMAVSFSAVAGPYSVGIEYEHENYDDTSNNLNSFSIIPGVVLDNGIKLDVRLTGRQTEESNTTGIVFEPRVKYMYAMNDTFALGGRVSVGEALQDSGDFAFYTIEPIAEWAFANRWLATASFMYRDSFGDKDVTITGAESQTIYLGAGYKVTDSQTVTARVYNRNNNDAVDSNGIEVNYTVGF